MCLLKSQVRQSLPTCNIRHVVTAPGLQIQEPEVSNGPPVFLISIDGRHSRPEEEGVLACIHPYEQDGFKLVTEKMHHITGVSHVTLAVKELQRSVTFYSELLGFELRMRKAHSAYLEAGTLWLALVVDENVRSGSLPEYTHLALTVSSESLPVIRQRLLNAGVIEWQKPERANSFYFLDPDGHKLELHSGTLADRLALRE